jgi:peptidoglycan/LPS O-acetylase OafA/YrhL
VSSVVFFHLGVHNQNALRDIGIPLTFLLRSGAHGVDLFFVLSGFCLAYPTLVHLHAEGQTRFNVAGYAARRVVRILPPYYLAIAVLFIVGLTLLASHSPLPRSMDPAAVSARSVLNQMAFIDHKYLESSFWTLAIEFRWYFLFPIVLWLWTRSRPIFAIVAIVSMTLAQSRIHSIDLFFLPTFMLGIVAADIYVREDRIARFAPFAFLGILAVALATTANGGWYWYDVGPYWGIAMFCLVVAVGGSRTARAVLSHKWFVIIGLTSYGIYLVHEPAIELIERSFPAVQYLPAQFIVGLCGAFGIGMLFSLLAERPFVQSRLRDWLVTKVERSFHVVLAACRLRLNVTMESAAAIKDRLEKTKAVA